MDVQRCRPHWSSLRIAVFLFLVLPASALARAPQELDVEAFRTQVDALAARAIKTGPLAGLSVGVAKGGKTLVAKGYGFADLEHNVPATEHTFYRIASMTKQFTAVAVMQLVEEGKLSLDDDLEKLLPEFKTTNHHVTLRRLLNHTSGIPSYTELENFPKQIAGVSRPADVFVLMSGKPFSFEPGVEFSYNNGAFYLAGEIAARTASTTYDLSLIHI